MCFFFSNFGSLSYPPPHTSLSAEAVAGMFLTMAGVTLCVLSSIDDKDSGTQNMTQAEH